MVAARVTACPLEARKPTRWTVIALIAPACATNATARNQKRLSCSAARTTRPRSSGVDGVAPDASGGFRTTRACSGTATTPYRTARMTSVPRQP